MRPFPFPPGASSTILATVQIVHVSMKTAIIIASHVHSLTCLNPAVCCREVRGVEIDRGYVKDNYNNSLSDVFKKRYIALTVDAVHQYVRCVPFAERTLRAAILRLRQGRGAHRRQLVLFSQPTPSSGLPPLPIWKKESHTNC